MAQLDKMTADKKGSKKSSGKSNNDMSNAVAATEKIRDWVRIEHR